MPQIFLRRHEGVSWLYQFSFNGKKFYSIADKNIVRVPPYEGIRNKLTKVLQGSVEAFDGCYCIETKTLAISTTTQTTLPEAIQ
jgi:hypothetical protein